MTVSRKILENEFGKEEPNIEELQKELKVAEQLVAEIVEITQTQRKFLQMHDQQQRLDVLDAWELKLQEACELLRNVGSFLDSELLSNVSSFPERPPPIDFGDEVDATSASLKEQICQGSDGA